MFTVKIAIRAAWFLGAAIGPLYFISMSKLLREPSGNNPEILSAAIKLIFLFSPNQTSALEITSSL